MKCLNVVATNSGLANFSTKGLVPGDCTSQDRFVLHSDESLWAAADKAHSNRHLAARQFGRMTQALGIAYHEAMLLLDIGLRAIARPISCCTFDWVHIWLVNGIANVELFNILSTLNQHLSLKYDRIDKFFQCWHWPSMCHNAPKRAFSPARAAASSEKFKAGASEILDLYPVLRCLFDKLGLKTVRDIRDQVLSVYAMFEVLDILASHPTTNQAADELEAAHTHHMRLHRAAYPDCCMIPKWHFAYHIPSQIRAHKHLHGTFAHERKHKCFKTHGSLYSNTTNFEKSVTRTLLNSQLHYLMKDASFLQGDFLVNAKEANTNIAKHFRGIKVFVSNHCSHEQVPLCSNDVVLCKIDDDCSTYLVKAKAFVQIEDPVRGSSHLLLGCPFGQLPNDVWALRDEPVEIPFANLVRPLIWSQTSEGVRVILPSR